MESKSDSSPFEKGGLRGIFHLGINFLVGIVFGTLNFWLLYRIVRGMVASETVSKRKTAFYFLAKMTLLFVTIGLILWKGYVSLLPFLGGYTVSLIAGIVLGLFKNKEVHHA